MGGYRSYQSPEAYRSDSIGDLILQGGRDAAAGAQRSGDIWGRAISGAGQAVSQGLEQYGAEKKANKRSQAIDKLFGGPEPPSFQEMVRVLGPKDAADVQKGMIAASPDGAKLYRDRMEQGRDAARGVLAVPEDKRPMAYDLARRGLVGSGVFKPEEAPEAFDPDFVTQLASYGKDQPKPAADQGFTLSPGQQRFGPGGESLAAVPERPPAGHMVTTPGPDGRPVQRLASAEELAGGIPAYREPKEPRAPREEKLERIETVGPDGKPVTQFVNPRAGASYARPTGAGKPATGQQKKALNYFNRGREAQEITSALEDGDRVSASRVKWTPDILNVTLSDDNQSYVQAQRAFTEARLRKDSGAAIKDSEYETDAKTYFIQPGDSKATIKQKQAARNVLLAGIAQESGDALREFYGDESEGMIEGYRRNSTATPRQSSAPVPVTSPAEAKKLPSGTLFRTPDGRTMRVP